MEDVVSGGWIVRDDPLVDQFDIFFQVCVSHPRLVSCRFCVLLSSSSCVLSLLRSSSLVNPKIGSLLEEQLFRVPKLIHSPPGLFNSKKSSRHENNLSLPPRSLQIERG